MKDEVELDSTLTEFSSFCYVNNANKKSMSEIVYSILLILFALNNFTTLMIKYA
jgi:hypothetical protein